MKPIVPISSIMTENVVKLNINDSLSKAEQLFKKHHIRHLPVVSGSQVVGILSYTDLLKVAMVDYAEDDSEIVTTTYNLFSLEQVMTKDIVSVVSYTSIREVAQIFLENDFRALPVFYQDKLVGIVTTTDIIKYLLDCY